MEKVQTGIVIEFYSNNCLVKVGGSNILCIGIRNIVVGDIVDVKFIQDSKKSHGKILKIHKRKSSLYKNLKDKKTIMAANIDRIGILVTSLPKTNFHFIDKWLLISKISKIKPFIILNKIDLTLENDFIDNLAYYKNKLNIKLLEISAKKLINVHQLKEYLSNRCTILVGKSGAGKSTITSLLTSNPIKTKELSNNQGVHTTSVSTLYHGENNMNIIDSPGIRDLTTDFMSIDDILDGFYEIKELSKSCKYSDCNHINNIGCNLKKALKQGQLNEKRYNSFIKIIKKNVQKR
jgi:ribosome biogenesis GTPase